MRSKQVQKTEHQQYNEEYIAIDIDNLDNKDVGKMLTTIASTDNQNPDPNQIEVYPNENPTPGHTPDPDNYHGPFPSLNLFLTLSHGACPDYLSPTILLIIFNITLPTMDLYRDFTMLMWLYSHPNYLTWAICLSSGVFLNFLFTCWAWWRLEPKTWKRWTWLLLLLQV